MLSFPEFSDIDTARTLFKTLEEKKSLLNIIGDSPAGTTDISIGEENELEEMLVEAAKSVHATSIPLHEQKRLNV